jgi:hypothetical protein|tara:strand:+ start:181 stop:906 length:726 start_codon:yes stop_codon:yes gene_type:complete
MIVLTAHQPVYLPWLGLFHKISLADKFVFFDEVQYLPKDWMNRNKIKTHNGSLWLTVPVLRKGYRDLKTNEIMINNSIDWRKKHLNTISLNYKKAPYYERYIDFFKDVYSKSWTYLADLNEYMLKWFLDELKIKVDFLKASDCDFTGTKSDLVLDMVKKLGAKTYIFGSLGKDYANEEDFYQSKINPIFQNYQHPSYPQLHGEFISHLSVLDLLFNCGPGSYKILTSSNIQKVDLKKDVID